MALQVIRGKVKTAVRGLIHGIEGVGKTTLASQLPNPVILDTEEGSLQIDCARVICNDWSSLEGSLHEIARGTTFGTVVIDSADWAERHIAEHIVRKHGKQSIEDFGYGKGYVMLGESIAKLLTLCDQIVARGVHVVFVAHSAVKRVSPPDETDGYDRWELKLTKHAAPLFKEWADLLLFATYRQKLVEGGDGRTKAIGGKERVLHAVRAAAWDAKNRFGLPDTLKMDIAEIAGVFENAAVFDARVPPSEKSAEIMSLVSDCDDPARLGKFRARVQEMLASGELSPDDGSAILDAIDAKDCGVAA